MKRTDDASAWRGFLQRIYPDAIYMAFQLSGGDSELAREAVHNTFLRLLSSKVRIDDLKEPLAYVRMAIRMSLIDEYRRRRRWQTEELDENWPDPHEKDESLGWDITRLASRLDPEDRQLLELQLRGLTLKEIAERLGLSYSAVAMRTLRLRKLLIEKVK